MDPRTAGTVSPGDSPRRSAPFKDRLPWIIVAKGRRHRKPESITFELKLGGVKTLDLRGFRYVAGSPPRPTGFNLEEWDWVEEFSLRRGDVGINFTELRTFGRA